jgi:hypothetical protein
MHFHATPPNRQIAPSDGALALVVDSSVVEVTSGPSSRNSPQCLHFFAAARIVSAHHGQALVPGCAASAARPLISPPFAMA